ncbi:MAG: hypothetical protein KAX38_02220 [Candidatus Krumholzibacteria bacterium]|nr:hypothetical protein [Candidatus Krumholzibacteria bacterium]
MLYNCFLALGSPARPAGRAVIVFVSLAVVACLAGCGGRKTGIAGKDPLRTVVRAENNALTLRAWVVNGAKADVLVHIDTSEDMRVFPESHMQSIRNAAERLRGGDEDVISMLAPAIESGGVVNLGYMAGLYKRVVWVVPSEQPIGEAPIETFRDFLMKRRGYSKEALKDLWPEGKYIEGTLAGVPLTITRLADFELGDEDVILDIDLAYFVGLSAVIPGYRSGTKSLLSFLQTLRSKALKANFITITLSTQGNVVPMDIRFFGSMIRESMINPATLEGSPPRKWARMIEAEDMLVISDYEAAESIYEQLALDNPDDPGIHFALAVVRGFMEKGIESREALLRAYSLDGAYVRGFLQLAQVLGVGGKVSTGEEILETSDLSNIFSEFEMNYQKGVFYLNAGRPFDAVTYLKKATQKMPNDFALQNLLYNAYIRTHNSKGIMVTLEKLRKIDEAKVRREIPWVYRELGKVYEEASLYKNAIEMYELYLEIAPGDTSAPEIMGKVDFWKSKYEKKDRSR